MENVITIQAFAIENALIFFIAACLLYTLSLVTYRLYFHPLRKLPGPIIAAATSWYEFYYDFVLGGQYTFHLQKLHSIYGPIIRISPDEVHIHDPYFFDGLYTGNTNPRDKWEFIANSFLTPTTFSFTVEADLHRARRAPFNQFFSKRSVFKLEPVLRFKVEKLCARIGEWKGKSEPLSMRYALAALALDMVTQYAFAKPYGSLDAPDFAPHWPDAVDSMCAVMYMQLYFPIIPKLMKKMPLWMVKRMDPNLGRMLEFQNSMEERIIEIMADNAQGKPPPSEIGHTTVFHSLLTSNDLPVSDRNLQHFSDEAQQLIGAGQITTGFFLNSVCWYILSAPHVLAKLKAELEMAIPDPNILPPVQKLEELEYLSAIVNEGHRMTHGLSHRQQRISRKTPIVYKDYVIPPGTPVGMTILLIHQDPSIFPEPLKFKPERWLTPESHALKKFQVAFGRGTRSCLGRHLAQAQIHLALAALFRRFEFEIFETVQEDMDITRDLLVPMPRQGSKGLRVLVH